jgi:hypothetical protein
MKSIFTLFFCFCVLNSQAQYAYSNQFVIKTVDLDKSVRYDTLSERMTGRRFVYCVIPDQFETIETEAVDGLAYAQKRVLSYEFTPPQYDSFVERIELHSAYSFYDIDRKAKLPKGAVLIPPTWEIAIGRILIDSTQFMVSRFKGLEMDANDNDCMGFVVIELPKSYLHTYQRRLKTAALLVQKVNGQTVIDTLKLPSPYLRETKVKARYLQKTTYLVKEPIRITVQSTSPTIPDNITGMRLKRQGGLSELREYIVCGRHYGPTIEAIQKSLRQRGYWVRTNNIMDNRTKRALTMFQKRHRLPVGTLNLETLKLLNVERFMKNGDSIGGIKTDYTVKTVSYDDLNSFDDLLFIEALTDEKIADMIYTEVKTIKARRKALGIKEVKRQVIPFKQ